MVKEQNTELHTRTAAVLTGLVEEYIRTAKPVGSMQLVGVLGLPVSPATVRNVLRALEEEGYVLQPHTSAGRIPTDKGYRFYVDHQQAEVLSAAQRRKLAKLLYTYKEQSVSPATIVAQALAKTTDSLAVSAWMDERDIRQAGFSALARYMGPESAAGVCEVLEMLDDVESVVQEFSLPKEKDSANVTTYIGAENPVMAAQHTSMLVRNITVGDKNVVLLLVGPKRMPYKRNIAWLNSVASIINEFSL